ncbi:hypothetical protein EDC96DRAFT_608616 [Choanephora cucurbitarum]|nr:hypothetical protein EDC96DRAFT_608616 [Choanephora cucurbitarum]
MSRQLPLEVLLQVFDHLKTRDLATCQQVCRQWCEPALILCYKFPSLLSKEKLDRFEETIESSPSLGLQVKELEISCDWELRENGGFLLHMPYLESLLFSCPYSNIYRVVFQLLCGGHLKHLKRIKNFCWDSDITKAKLLDTFYFHVASRLADRLEEVALDTSLFEPEGKEPRCFYSASISKRTKFPKAKSVYCSSKNRISIQQLEDMLDLCPIANKFTLSTGYFSIYQKDLISAKSYPHLTTLSMIWEGIFKFSFQYFAAKFPNVKELNVYISYSFYILDVNYVASLKNELEALIKYVSTMNKFTITMESSLSELAPMSILTSATQKGYEVLTLAKEKFFESVAEYSYQQSSTSFSVLRLKNVCCSLQFCENHALFLETVSKLHFSKCREDITMSENFDWIPSLIDCLTFTKCNFSENGLYQLSSYRPFIKHLQLINVKLPLKEGMHSIQMPFTEFETHELNSFSAFSFNSFVIHIKQEEDDAYYKCTKDKQLSPASSDDFKDEDVECRVNLTCKSIKKLELSLGSYIYTLYLKENREKHPLPAVRARSAE